MDRDRDVRPSGAGFTADPAERLARPRAPVSRADATVYFAILGACLIHASLLSFLLFENRMRADVAPAAQEIPVEIVVEPPPQEKPDGPAPPPMAQPIADEIATDAPRAANKEKVEREAPDEATKAPPAPQSKQPAEAASAQAAAPKEKAEGPAAESSAEPLWNNPAAEATEASQPDRAISQQQAAPADATPEPESLAKVFAEQAPDWSAGAAVPAVEPYPDIEVGSAAEDTPISGGKAKSTYLSILYGMIMSHVRVPPDAPPSASRTQGAIDFTIDGKGVLMHRKVARSSGSPALDSAALAAIAAASPFPPPPQGMPARLTFSYSAN